MFHQSTPPPSNSAASGMTRWRHFAWARRFGAVLAAVLVAFAAAPAAAQVTVSFTSTPANGEYYVAGESITTRISGLPRLHNFHVSQRHEREPDGSRDRRRHAAGRGDTG